MPKAVQYVLQVYDQIGSLDELLQMAIIDVVRLDCKGDSTHRVRFFPIMLLLEVLMVGIGEVDPHYFRVAKRTLICCKIRGCHHIDELNAKCCCRERFVAAHERVVHIHTHALLAAASTLINIVIKESDNNVKLIVLDRLENLRSKHGHVFDSLIMDVLQVLSRCDHSAAFHSISLD